MKKCILPVMLIFIVLFIAGCATIENYTIEGDTVWIEDGDIGKITVTPHTRYISYGCQYANVTSYLNTQDLDIAFRFDMTVTEGKVYTWINHSHSVDNWTDVCEDEFINSTWMEVCHSENNPYEVHSPAWKDVTNYLSHTEYNNKHYYIASDINFIQDKVYQYKWCFEAPTESGKWDLLAKRSIDTIQGAYDSGNFIMLDPWWDTPSLDTDLFLYFKFDGDYTDELGHRENDGSTGSFIGGGKLGQGYEIEGAEFFQYNQTLTPLSLPAVSSNFWFKPTNNWGSSVSRQDIWYDANADGMKIFYDWQDGKLTCFAVDDTYAEYTTTFTGGTWYMITCTYSSGTVKLYVNGDLKNTYNGAAWGATGSDSKRFGVSGGETFTIDEWGFWHKVLSSIEITALYNSGEGSEYCPNTLFINRVNITPVIPTYLDSLNCSVNFTTPSVADEVNINFTWLKDSVSNYTCDEWLTDQPGGDGILVHSPTLVDSLLEDENWTCVVYIENNTNADVNYTSSFSKIIASIAPTFDYALNWSDYHSINVSLDYNCTDIDGDPINYTILNLTNNFNTDLTINISTGIISYDTIQNETGERLFNVTCTDGSENTTSWLNITILNRPPTIPTTAPANNTYFANNYNLTCNASTDPESDTIYYQFWNTINNLQNSTNTTYLLDIVGDTVWRCRACDYVDDSQSYVECSNYTGYQITTLYSFTNCTGGNVSVFFRYKDEDTNAYIPASLKANLQITISEDEQEFLFDLPLAMNHSFCLTGRENTTISTGMLEYYNSTYDARNYYFYNAQITNVTQNITLYLLPADLATGITINVEDESGEALEGYTVYVERYSVETNSYALIAMAKTDTNGQDVVFLRGGTADTGDVWYRFKVYYQGTLLKTTLSQKVISTSITLRLGESDWIEHQEILGDTLIDLTFNEGTHTFSLDYSTISGLPRHVCMQVFEQRPGGYVYELNHTCETTASGLILYTLPTTIHNYKAVAYVTGSAPENKAILYWRNVTNVFGNTGILLTVGLIILLSLIGAFSPIAAIIFGTIGLVIASMIGLITVGQTVITTIVVLAIIMIMKLGRENL